MRNLTFTRFKQLFPWSNAKLTDKSNRSRDEPDKMRRSLLIGGLALIGSGLLLTDLIPDAQAHRRRRSRRAERRGRHRRRHSRRHHSRRRSRYDYHGRRRSRYHGRRRSRYDYHGRRRSRYDYHSRRRSRRSGFDLYLEF